MKAFESNEQYVGKVRECTNYAVRSIKNLVKDGTVTNKRQPCGPEETKMNEFYKTELGGFCDSVTTSTYNTDLSAHKASNIFVFVFMLLAVAAAIAANFIKEWFMILLIASLVFSILALLAHLGAFGGTSKNIAGENIIAVRKPRNEAKQRLILEANTDAPFKRKKSRKAEAGLSFLNILAIIIYLAYAVVYLLKENNILQFNFDYFYIISYVLIIFLPIPIVLAVSVNTNASSLGVTDNLTGVYTCLGTLRYLSEIDFRLESTEIDVVLCGAKNAGTAGAKTWAKEHATNEKEFGSVVICLDTLNSAGMPSMISNGKTKNALKFIEKAKKNAEVEIPEKKIPYLKGDGKAIAKKGLPCITLTSLPDEIPDFYKSDLDTDALLDPKPVEAAIKLVLETAFVMDEPKTE